MSNSILYPAAGSRDRFTASVMADIRIEMMFKLDELRTKQALLMLSLEKKFDEKQYRELSLVNHKIEVCTVRRRGEWMHGTYPQLTTIAKSRS